ncbi:2-oxo acid dehydrogenase subunit E2 [Actinosynnema pretiosum subsp. pretiosum]|uniref:Dihydrolipoamide acetyltransferase component of pyruvate dehydrogenase complex n=2 Tax=Actinosynnema TaxID=40566 RepID=C6WS04_ACTMD|nr:dihydrolipoamide acetyltransferase family protein [Actinosynnema mirum]ACU38824.1 catalytic domain of components of various dehydrogenase complexes [Actinosynnema mirum DSM 43827]AXX32417.1 Dihydrolipoamide acyltransferase component of branched-chain alpha-keto acid dehydrogenase complex [Actinosynnema pretiosum subsp. pretiosum]QUF03655.1 2-oxo acid dehydrogenase subunit E2 [Actinosynnema pretiosum subsp. pretiosum]
MPDFRLPDLGEGLTDGEIVSWLVAVGDPVVVDQPVVEVETAKAVVEVPCPYGGVVTARHGEPGQRLAVGSVLLSVAGDGAGGAAARGEPVAAEAAAAEPGAAQGDSAQAHSAQADSAEYSGNVLVGYGTSQQNRRRRRVAHAPVADEPAAAAGPAKLAPAVISPLVRRLARDSGVALETVEGSGPGGVIRRADVEREIAARAPRPARAPGPWTEPAAASPGQGKRIPLTGVRGVAARKFATSRREIPEATVWVDVDATGLVEARAALPAVSLLGLLARFTALGLRRFPELNSRVEGDEVVLLDEVNLGFAAQTDRGLVVPVVRGAHALTATELTGRLRDLTASARDGELTAADLTGGTFTLNNYGVFGVDGSAAIINHPEVAILGIGRIADRPWAHEGQLALRKVAQLTLSFDHRVCDGGVAGGFLRYVADLVENPVALLADV